MAIQRILLSVSLCLLTAQLSAQQPNLSSTQPKLPDTIVAQRLAGFLEAFNSGDSAKMRAFHQQYTSAEQAEQNASMDSQFYADSGGVDLQSVVQSSEHRITVLVKTHRDQNWMRLTLEVEPSPPHAIAGLGLREASPPLARLHVPS
jgi:hypothetical protein